MGKAWTGIGLAAILAASGCATSNGLPPNTVAYQMLPPRNAVIVQQPQSYPSVRSAIQPGSPPSLAIPTQPSSPTPAQIGSAPATSPEPAATINPAATDFASRWEADLRQARKESAQCAGLNGEAQSRCWQSVAAWAKQQSSSYGRLSGQEKGARMEQARSAAHFFAVTAQWASACSSLSARACASSPLIAQMQRWKESVGIGSRP